MKRDSRELRGRLGRWRDRRRARLLARLLVTLLFLLPLAWMVIASLYPPGQPLPQQLGRLPGLPTGRNFLRIWSLVPMGRYTLNSLLVCALATPLSLIVSSWAGFAISQLSRASQRRWVLLSLAALMAPGVALWPARFFIYRELGWIDTIWALIAPAWMGTSPFFVLMFFRAFRRIPQAIYESARLDGAGVLIIWRRVALPMVRPTAIAVALLAFIHYWGDYLSPLLYLSSDRLTTLPVALQLIQQMSRSDWPLLMAAAVWATLIPVSLFVLAQPVFRGVSQPEET
jgi:multiple sugar transport system permease protein